MVLKAKLESLDELDSSLHEHYKKDEAGGGFVLDIEGGVSQKDVDTLKKSLTNERESHKQTKNKLGAYSALGDVEEIHSKLEKFPELELASKGKLDDNHINGIVETRIKSRLAPLERERDKLKADVAERDTKIGEYTAKERRGMITGELTKAAKAAKVADSALEDIELYGDRVFEITEAGTVVTKDGVGVTPGLSPKEWLSDMQAKRPHWWGPTQGGGANGSRGGAGVGQNPFSREHWNMTEQGNIVRSKGMAEAERLAKIAGTTVGGAMPAERKQVA